MKTQIQDWKSEARGCLAMIEALARQLAASADTSDGVGTQLEACRIEQLAALAAARLDRPEKCW